MNKMIRYLLIGLIFGFTLSRVGASDFDLLHLMFRGVNLKIAWVIVTAIVTSFIGMRVLAMAGNRTYDGEKVKVSKKKLSWRNNVIGGVLFGIGWGMTGACPGTVLAQVGEGKLLGIISMSGMLLGTYVYAWLVERNEWMEG
jgi:uncharacterized membrane protein YedE/YeeE